MTNYASDLDRIREELADSFDEELEMELDESRLESLLIDAPDREQTLDRGVYFRSLFKLQHELVRLQDWVQNKGLKVVILFEGRIVRELAGDELSEERILSAAFNLPDEEAAACAPVD